MGDSCWNVRDDFRMVMKFTCYWILYGALTLTVVAVLVSAIKGLAT